MPRYVRTHRPPDAHPAAAAKLVIKAVRPAMTDLRFKGDAAVVREGRLGSVRLGDTLMGTLTVTRIDVPTLNRTLEQIRTGQARRNIFRRRVSG